MINLNIRYISLLSLALACGGLPEEDSGHKSTLWYTQTPEWALDIPVPGQEGRIDGSVWNDGMFRTEEAREEFCAEWGGIAEAWFCSEVGQLEQSWKSSEYHGLATDGGTCYGPSSGGGTNDCLFPEMKHVRIIMTGTDCYDGPAPPDGPSTLQEDAILFGIKEGVLMWDNLGAGSGTASDIVSNGTPGTDWYAPLKITCSENSSSNLAKGGLNGNAKKRVNNMPVGPSSGKNPDDAYVIKDLQIDVNIPLIWEKAKDACGDGETVSLMRLREFAWSIGVHEAGHSLGFGHFTAGGNLARNVMYPWRSQFVCLQEWSILPDYIEALGYLDTPSAEGTTIADHGLQAQRPE